ncbi:MAG: hypothetical protein JWM99_4813, partial [Verrucomicrobiales bacterium]|nr:hypothetical protein [Verrucomicrobiales bacterium]
LFKIRRKTISAIFYFSLIVCGAVGGPGLSSDTTGRLLLNGKPFRGIGVNYYDAFVRTLESPARTNYTSGFRELASLEIPFARISAGGYWPIEWGLYRTNRTQYFAQFDALVKSAEKNRIGLIPSLFWLLSTVPDLVGEPCDQWGNPESRTIAFMREYTGEMVGRYHNSSAIWAWEFGNEYNLGADLPNAGEHRPATLPQLGTPAARSARDDLTHEAFRRALVEFAKEVRLHDPDRLILSGNAFPRASAWHQQHSKNWEIDTADQFAEVLAADNPEPIDSLTVRLYDDSDSNRIRQAMMLGQKLNKPLFVGEFGVPGKMNGETRNRFKAQLDRIEIANVPLAALWVYDFNDQAENWTVTSNNSRSEQLKAISDFNRRLHLKP